MKTLFEDDWVSTAVFGGENNIYRYRLSRIWDKTLPKLLFSMLNPSKATAERSDPTVTRCIGFAAMLGFGGLEVVNIFALRSTDPEALYDHWEPVGADNDDHIIEARRECGMVICAWGKHGVLQDRGAKVHRLLKELGPVHCLKLNRDGSPGHPLYIPAVTKPFEF